jgi:hypothetical protein
MSDSDHDGEAEGTKLTAADCDFILARGRLRPTSHHPSVSSRGAAGRSLAVKSTIENIPAEA